MSFIKNSIFGTFRDPCPACCPSRGISAAQQPQHQLRGGLIAFVTNILKYICFCLPINFLEFHFSCQQSSFFKILAALPYDWQMQRQKTSWEEPLHWVLRECMGASLGASTCGGRYTYFLPPTQLRYRHTSSFITADFHIIWLVGEESHLCTTFQKVMGVIKTTSWHYGTSSPKQQLAGSDIAKDCLLPLVKNRLALGSPGCLFVTMPKMAQYTGKWLLLSP